MSGVAVVVDTSRPTDGAVAQLMGRQDVAPQVGPHRVGHES